MGVIDLQAYRRMKEKYAKTVEEHPEELAVFWAETTVIEGKTVEFVINDHGTIRVLHITKTGDKQWFVDDRTLEEVINEELGNGDS